MLKKLFFGVLALLMAIWVLTSSAAAEPEPVSLPVIMYHHIHAASSRWGTYVVSPDTFEKDLAYLKEHGYATISMAQLLAFIRGESPLPDKPIMITFDDGQLSFAKYALPLLEKYDMCAVLSIIGRPADEYTESGDQNVSYASLSWPALAELAASEHVELAAHTYDMHATHGRQGCKIAPGESTAAYRAAFTADLEQLEDRFRRHIGQPPIGFAYPYGQCCEEAAAVLTERGYQVLFTCRERVNLLTGDPQDLLELGRFNRPNNADRTAFFTKLDP